MNNGRFRWSWIIRNLIAYCTDEPLPQLPWRMTSNVRFSNPLERKTWVRYSSRSSSGIEPNRTNKKYSNWKKNWMLYFRKSSIEFGHQTEWSSLQKNTNGTKSSGSSVETAKAIWSFVSFITVKPVCNGPVLSGHSLLSGQFSKSGFFACTNAVFVPCSPTLSFFVILPVLSGHQPWTETKPYIILCNF